MSSPKHALAWAGIIFTSTVLEYVDSLLLNLQTQSSTVMSGLPRSSSPPLLLVRSDGFSVRQTSTEYL